MRGEYSALTEGIRVKVGGPRVGRLRKEGLEGLRKEGKELVDRSRREWAGYWKEGLCGSLKGLEGKHFLIIGGSGNGLGSAMVFGVLELIRGGGSLMMVSRDIEMSLGYVASEYLMGVEEGLSGRLSWSNEGLDLLRGKGLERILEHLKVVGAKRVIYINTVASAISGMLPGKEKVYIKDVDDAGLFQWDLKELSEKEVERTKGIMGDMAVLLVEILEREGFEVEASIFADWRGSLDKVSRDESYREYGRNGAYSTSLHLPKEVIQEAVLDNYRSGKNVGSKMIDIFYPVMKTRALSYIPGGMMMARILDHLMGGEGFSVNELGLKGLECIRRLIFGEDGNPFPRLDLREVEYELWYYEIIRGLNEKEGSEFYYKNWIR